MQEIEVSRLKPHQKNDFYFDDMEGAKWKEFVASIKARGVIEPIIATDDLVIVSGHQRIRACKELGIEKVIVEVRHYDNDDEVIQDLLETNVRQRGTIGGSDIKLSRRIRELERLYGIGHGGDRKSHESKIKATNGHLDKTPSTLEELAAMLGFDDVRGLQRAKKFGELPEDVQQAVNEGRISKSTAIRVIAQLPVDEQEALIKSLPATEKLTTKQVQELIKANEDLQNSIDALNSQLENAHDENEELHEQLENQPVKVETRTVYPHDYEDLKRENADQKRHMEYQRLDYKRLSEERQTHLDKIRELEQRINELSEDIPDEKERVVRSAKSLMMHVFTFLDAHGGSVFVADHLDMLDPTDKDNYVKAIIDMAGWANSLLDYINGGNMIG